MRAIATCKYCGKPLALGSDAVELDTYAEGIYCSERCAKEALLDAVAEIYNATAREVTIEETDPYARYGLNRGDF